MLAYDKDHKFLGLTQSDLLSLPQLRDQSLRGYNNSLQPTIKLPTGLPFENPQEGFPVISQFLYSTLILLLGDPDMLRSRSGPSIWTIGPDHAVIPGVAFTR